MNSSSSLTVSLRACARLCSRSRPRARVGRATTSRAPRDVIGREAPGFAETIRQESRQYTPLGILTRGVSGIRGRTLIVNFPGSPNGVRQSWPVVEPTLGHAAATLERE